MTETGSAQIGGKKCTWNKWPAYQGAREMNMLARLIAKDVLGSLLDSDDPELDLIAKGSFNAVADVLVDLVDSACGEAKLKRKLELIAEHPGLMPQDVDDMLAPLYPYDGFDELALHWVVMSKAEVDGVVLADAGAVDGSSLNTFEFLTLAWKIASVELRPLSEALALWRASRPEGAKTGPASSDPVATD